MTARILLVFAVLAIVIVISLVGRNLYLRSLRLRRRLQMSYMFTNITHELLTPLTVISASVDKLRDEAPQHGHDYDLMQYFNGKRWNGKGYNKDGIIDFEKVYGLEITTSKGQIFSRKRIENENGEVTLKVQTNTTFDHIRIEVSDTGDGIPPEKMKYLFQRFHDGEYRKHQTIGTGIGLNLTHDLVYLHHGTIRCDSEVGKGTTFTVELPINKESFSPDQIDESRTIDFNIPKNAFIDVQALTPDVYIEEDDPQDQPDEDIYRLLVVEDNAELLMLMRQLLKATYHVYAAKNGREALKIIHQKDLDLIISDVMMPEMDGYALTKAIKSDPNYNHLPIILLTAKTQEEDEQEALLLGADEYLTKPFRLKDLKLRIDNIIENRKRIQFEYHQETADDVRRIVASPSSSDEEFLSRAIECVYSHLSDDTYDRDTLAADMGASPSTIYNKLRSITGLSVSSFIRDIRLKEAHVLAQATPTLRVSDLAYKVGFRDPRYFSTCFKKQFGMQPKEFMESLYPEKNQESENNN